MSTIVRSPRADTSLAAPDVLRAARLARRAARLARPAAQGGTKEAPGEVDTRARPPAITRVRPVRRRLATSRRAATGVVRVTRVPRRRDTRVPPRVTEGGPLRLDTTVATASAHTAAVINIAVKRGKIDLDKTRTVTTN